MSDSAQPDSAAERAILAQALFSPASIMLVGASEDSDKLTSRPLRVLRRHGFRGRLFPIPTGSARDRALITRTPGIVEHALIMTPAPAVAQTVEECAAAGVKVATVLSAGFAELGRAGRRREEALAAAAKRSGIRVLGPNSLGIVNVTGRMVLSANAVFERETLRAGGLSVLSQSGSMLGAIVTRAQARGLCFSKLAAMGNECDLRVGELVDLLVDDPDTRAILLFLEALRDAPRLAQAARRAYDAGKPVIAYKLGRSAVGRRLAHSHTGAMTSTDDLSDAFFDDHGILRVTVFEALFEAAHLVLDRRPSLRHRLATVTVSGGGAAMVLDSLPADRVELVAPPPGLIARLAAQRIRVAPAPVIDLPMGRADGGAYAAVLAALLQSEHCDLVLAVQGSNASYQPDSVRERILAAGPNPKPLAVFLTPNAEDAGRLLHAHGIAAFHTPEACADAIRAYCAWRAPSTRVAIGDETMATIRTAVPATSQGLLNEWEAYRLLHALGIPYAPGQVVRSGAEPIELDFPLAAKILSRDIAHKTEVDGIVLDITTRDELPARVAALLQRVATASPRAALEGVLLQTMQRGVGEVIVGFRRDPEVGPVVLLAPGGVLAELGMDRVVRTAPLGVETALQMVLALPALQALRGYRHRPKADLHALAQTIHRLSLLADQPRILEAEINPLIVKVQGVVAVDALVRLQSAST